MKRIIVAGPRDFLNKKFIFDHLKSLTDYIIHVYQEDIEIVEGGATGVDSLAKEFALRLEYPIKEFQADWKTFQKQAGPIRNQNMAEYADILIAFDKGTKGTRNMIKTAIDYGLEVHIVSIADKNEKEDTYGIK